ncbi:MAG TPA: oligopeptidase A [Nevskiales bacterium]|nr:oligopeptidase A [Nevskiales bacterium]
MQEATENPLLELLEQEGLPPFSRIRAEHAEPAVDRILAENRQAVATLLARGGPWDWDRLARPLEELDDRLHRAWAPAAHLNHVLNSEGWRTAYNACLAKLSDYATELGQNEDLYRAWQALAEGPEFAQLDPGQQKLVRDTLRDFRLSGVALPPADKARFKDIMQQLSRLQSRFEENLLDATQAWEKSIADARALAGLPPSALAQAQQQARNRGLDGWLLTLEFPSYHAVITYADDRALREEIYTAFCTRASDQGPHAGRFDNSALMEDILRLRHEAARLLGYANFAERSLATKMAQTPAQVLDFLRDLARRSRPRAERELAELRDFARATLDIGELQAWDIAYASEKLRQARFRISDEELRPYFPLPQVLDGLFAIVGRLYGVRIEPLTGADVWHADVTAYEIRDAEGVRGRFFLDPYARPNKRGGAWMDDCAGRRRGRRGLQIPIAFLTCNFTPPLPGQPALLSHEEVITLFHEFGHGLQHLLTRVETAGVAGINGVPWDAVELPSQFMENWCWERESLDLMARHWQSGAPLPEDLYRRLRAARNFQSALMMLRQVEFALFDFRLHLEYDPARGGRVLETAQAVRDEVAVFQPPAFNRFPHSFAHVFAGGYAAGYYSYKWAEVLSADAYSAFEEAGLFDPATGRRFLSTILEQGGSREAMELFVAFRGRPPTIEPLLRHNGLLDQAA